MSDIEQALAEGLPSLANSAYISKLEAARAILATPSMQEVARLARIGAAVEAEFDLAGNGFDHISITKSADRMDDGYVPDPDTRWSIESGLVTHRGTGPTIEAAIAAALGEDERPPFVALMDEAIAHSARERRTKTHTRLTASSFLDGDQPDQCSCGRVWPCPQAAIGAALGEDDDA